MPDADGYIYVAINGRRFSVSRLVLKAFVGPCPEGQQARHLNGDRTDNRLANLAWGSVKVNAEDRHLHGHQIHGVDQWNSKLTPLKAIEIAGLARSGVSQAQIGLLYGVGQNTVWKISRGISWSRATGIRPDDTPKKKGGRPRLSPSQLDQMVRLRQSGKSQAAIATTLGVTQGAICLRLRERGLK